MKELMPGKKSFIVGAIIVAAAIVEAFIPVIPIAPIVWKVLGGLGIITIRQGMKNK